MKTGYITDQFSTLGGLASVAYGDPEYFREVQNQIYSRSPSRFLDLQRPSDVLESFFGSKRALTELVLGALETQYSQNPDFTDYIDVNYGPNWRQVVGAGIEKSFFGYLDSVEDYGLSLSDYVKFVERDLFPNNPVSGGLTPAIYERVLEEPLVGQDAALMARLVSNNPQTKLSVPPLNSRVDLNNSVDLGYDYRGIDISTGYISPQNYWNDVAYPGMTDSSTPVEMRDSVVNGYVGYVSSSPLESLYNPSGSQSISDASVNFPYSPSILDQFPDNLQADRDVYSISLIGEQINGFTTFDPATMSNGDLLDTSLVPTFEKDNADPQGGLISSARKDFSPVF